MNSHPVGLAPSFTLSIIYQILIHLEFHQITRNFHLQVINMVFLSMAIFMVIVPLLSHHHRLVQRLCLFNCCWWWLFKNWGIEDLSFSSHILNHSPQILKCKVLLCLLHFFLIFTNHIHNFLIWESTAICLLFLSNAYGTLKQGCWLNSNGSCSS